MVSDDTGTIILYITRLDSNALIKIYFPAVKGPATFPVQAEESKALPRGTETILLVEDEALVRDLTSRILKQQGYKVLVATNGEEAFRLFRDNPESEIHLLLTDLVMPRMGGKELASKLLALKPRLKVLLTSGYTGETLTRQDILNHETAFIQKPFTPLALARKVREVLDQKEVVKK